MKFIRSLAFVFALSLAPALAQPATQPGDIAAAQTKTSHELFEAWSNTRIALEAAQRELGMAQGRIATLEALQKAHEPAPAPPAPTAVPAGPLTPAAPVEISP